MPARDAHLPSRPWTRDDVPLVWRSDTCVEMGWPPHSMRIDDVDPSHLGWLLALQGDHDVDHAISSGAEQGLRPALMRRLLDTAVRCGLVDDAGAMPLSLRDAPLHVRDHLASEVAAVRHLHGGTEHAREVIDRRRSAEIAVQGASPVADAVALVLTSAGIGNVVQEGVVHSASKRHRRTALDRVCHVLCDLPHPDTAADPDAMALDIPHLAVAVTGTCAVIGPLVLPGRTSCLRCRDLHLADADPAWPRVAVQWSSRRPGPAAAGLAHLAGAWAALQALALVDAGPRGVHVPTLDGALVVRLPGADVSRASRPPHPLCGCLWPETGSSHARRTLRAHTR